MRCLCHGISSPSEPYTCPSGYHCGNSNDEYVVHHSDGTISLCHLISSEAEAEAEWGASIGISGLCLPVVTVLLVNGPLIGSEC